MQLININHLKICYKILQGFGTENMKITKEHIDMNRKNDKIHKHTLCKVFLENFHLYLGEYSVILNRTTYDMHTDTENTMPLDISTKDSIVHIQINNTKRTQDTMIM